MQSSFVSCAFSPLITTLLLVVPATKESRMLDLLLPPVLLLFGEDSGIWTEIWQSLAGRGLVVGTCGGAGGGGSRLNFRHNEPEVETIRNSC